MGPGLYVIHCIPINKFYIGQSGNASYRLGRHYENLLVNRSDAKELQEDWNKYGQENFSFIVLASGPAYADENIRLDMEKKLIDLNVGSIYNIAKLSHHGRKVQIRWKNTIFNTIAEASRVSGVSKTQIARLAKDPDVSDWERIADNIEDSSLGLNSEKSKILSVDGVLYRSMRDAAKQLNISRRTIGRRLENPTKYPNSKYISNDSNTELSEQSDNSFDESEENSV